MRFTDLKVGFKLGTAFALLLVVTLCLGGVSLWQLQRMNSALHAISDDAVPTLAEAGNLRAQWNRIRRIESQMLGSIARDINQKHVVQIQSILADIQASEAIYKTLDRNAKELELMQRYVSHRDQYMAAHQKFAQVLLLELPDLEEAERIYHHAEDSFVGLAQTIGTLAAMSQTDAKALRQVAQNVERSAWVWVLSGMAVAALLSAVFAMVVTRSIALPAARALQMANHIARGDLSQPVHATGRDEMGQLMQALERMRLQLLEVVSGVRRNADALAMASEEIAMGSLQLSSRTEEQAAALEQTAASMEELGTTVQHNADNAVQAHALSGDAADVAQRSGDAVAKVVDTMRGIREASAQITGMVGVIEGIAFQTNILALNAAVEAARAGEQGRGFAVVAGEVRTLAGRCAQAAKEIKHVVDSTGQRILAGSDMADQAGATMLQVVQSIARVNTLIAAISAASAEQSAGVQQMGHVVSELDTNTQSNASLVEENAAASDNLKQQAQALVRAVAIFKTHA